MDSSTETKKSPFTPNLTEVLSSIPCVPDLSHKRNLASHRKLFEWTPEQAFTDPQISHVEKRIPGPDGDIALTILRKKGPRSTSRPGIYFLHGGGLVMGTRYTFLQAVFEWVKQIDAVVISAEYRLAPEHPSPAGFEDAYVGFQWTADHAAELDINPKKLLIAGASAGGGLAAAVALKARDDKGLEPCGQLLLYPMLDDRCATKSMEQFSTDGTWTGVASKAAWDLVLPGRRGSDKVNVYEAPGRAIDLSGLPPTFIEVASTEPFRDECVNYASNLCINGVETELHLWPGIFHSSEVFAPDAYQSQGAFATRLAWVKELLLERD
ncbi:hypothetical protein VE01_04448 [Pseudogymnoascus verrucosus]|uniref:Alpha/beta hydrolase fold-3 domain-containing protein n=1 Tax=Pseudogymnoascus verrucosus TaxID=342668 RepID=A0A1B8GP06_9PEZI|nr:uncharacterized protein VE01_04448 [Pseudogymnoascus verrucosus]OBT97579.1 hypothetical protein VE01_04448 [Pseudogymnoascus verrucosus]